MATLTLPTPALIVLVGPSGAGKSTFARRHFAPTEVVSSDSLRAMLGDDPGRQDINEQTFELLHRVVEIRLSLLRSVVVDATNLEARGREPLRRLARAAGLPAVLVVLDLPQEECVLADARRDRSVGPAVIAEQFVLLTGLQAAAPNEGWSEIHAIDPRDAVVERIPLPPDRRDEAGPFDLIGDVHGCDRELGELLAKLGYDDGRHPDGRRLVFVGDLVDRGPDSPGVLRRVLPWLEDGRALAVPGNHEERLLRWWRKPGGDARGGLKPTLEQLDAAPDADDLRRRAEAFFADAPPYLWLDDGDLLVAHGGLEEALHGRIGKRVRGFALYGKTTGKRDAQGLPERLDWAPGYSGRPAVVHGHVPVARAEWRNNTANIDLGCCFGGRLCALRWPERTFIDVPAERCWWPLAGARRRLPPPGEPAGGRFP